jgi:hypothetical protein
MYVIVSLQRVVAQLKIFAIPLVSLNFIFINKLLKFKLNNIHFRCVWTQIFLFYINNIHFYLNNGLLLYLAVTYHLYGLLEVPSWLRHYATSRKVAGSSPDEVDFFNWPNPSSCTMALGSTQSLTEMSTRNLPGG